MSSVYGAGLIASAIILFAIMLGGARRTPPASWIRNGFWSNALIITAIGLFTLGLGNAFSYALSTPLAELSLMDLAVATLLPVAALALAFPLSRWVRGGSATTAPAGPPSFVAEVIVGGMSVGDPANSGPGPIAPTVRTGRAARRRRRAA